MRRLGSSSPNTGLPASMMGSQGLAGSRVGPSPLWSLLSNKYMYLFVITWATIHISLGACTVMGIVAKKLGYGAVTANLLGTVSDKNMSYTVCLTWGFSYEARYAFDDGCWIM